MVVFGCYLLAFVTAFAMVFMLPVGALLLVFVGLMGLIPVVTVAVALRAFERPLARAKLQRGDCPACGEHAIESVSGALESAGAGGAAHFCRACGTGFSQRGEDMVLPEPTTL